jgi:hypothetical protein
VGALIALADSRLNRRPLVDSLIIAITLAFAGGLFVALFLGMIFAAFGSSD